MKYIPIQRERPSRKQLIIIQGGKCRFLRRKKHLNKLNMWEGEITSNGFHQGKRIPQGPDIWARPWVMEGL